MLKYSMWDEKKREIRYTVWLKHAEVFILDTKEIQYTIYLHHTEVFYA